MSELFDKEVNAQKESLKKNFRGSLKLPQAHEKVCDENETKKQEKQVDFLPSKNQALCDLIYNVLYQYFIING